MNVKILHTAGTSETLCRLQLSKKFLRQIPVDRTFLHISINSFQKRNVFVELKLTAQLFFVFMYYSMYIANQNCRTPACFQRLVALSDLRRLLHFLKKAFTRPDYALCFVSLFCFYFYLCPLFFSQLNNHFVNSRLYLRIE